MTPWAWEQPGEPEESLPARDALPAPRFTAPDVLSGLV